MKIKKSYGGILLFLCMFVFLFPGKIPVYAEETTDFTLNQEEEEALSLLRKGSIRVGYATDVEYSEYGEGISYGLFAPVKDFLENELELTVEFKRYKESDLENQLVNRNVDLIFFPYDSENQDGYFMSEPVYERELVYLSGERNKKPEPGEVVGCIVGCREEKRIKESMASGVVPSNYHTVDELFRAVSGGVIDGAVVSKQAALSAVKTEGIWAQPLGQRVPYSLTASGKKMEQLLLLFDRFLNQTQDGEICRARFEEEEKNYLIAAFLKEKGSELGKLKEKLKDKQEEILYYAGDSENYPYFYSIDGEDRGIIPEMISFFEMLSGISFYREQSDSVDVKERQSDGEISMILSTAYLTDSSKVCMSRSLFYENLLLAGYPSGEGDLRYFGITEELSDYFDDRSYHPYKISEDLYSVRNFGNDRIMGNKIVYPSSKELLTAVSEEKVHQIIYKEGNADYDQLFGKNKDLVSYGVLQKIPEHFVFSAENRDLCDLVDEMIRYYEFYRMEDSVDTNVKQIYRQQLLKSQKAGLIKTVVILLLSVVLLAAGVLFFLMIKKGRHLQVIEKPAERKALEEKEGKKETQKKKEVDSDEDTVSRQNQEIDELTGLYTRNIFQDKICEIVEKYPDTLGVFAFVDMDRLKKINQYFGREAGDAILLQLARSLKILTEGDHAIAFRMGGDDFGLFYGNLKDESEVQGFCQKLRDLTLQIKYEEDKITANFSIGISIFNKDAFSLLELMDCADEAMNCCKQNGLKMSYYRAR